MNFEMFAESELVARISWTLFHSLWQITLVTVSLLVALHLMRRSSPQTRYVMCVIALAASFVIPVLTFIQISNDATGNPQSNRTPGLFAATVDTEAMDTVVAGPVSSSKKLTTNAAESAGPLSDLYRWLGRVAPTISPIAVAIWMLGVALFAMRLVAGFTQVRRYRRGANSEVDEDWLQKFAELCKRTSVKGRVTLLRSESVHTPIVVGVLRPLILVPAGLFLQMHPRELETIIAHELIHIRRYDPLVSCAQCVIEALMFYHPAVWWISALIRREREFVADRVVTEIFEGSHVTYARALANLEEIRLRTDQKIPRYATAANGGNFMQRIQRILKIKTEANTANSAWTAGLAFVLTSVFLLAIFSTSSSELVNAQKLSNGRKLAIGFVSIPPVDRTTNPPKDSDATARLLIEKLKLHKVPAIGFLQGGMVSDGEKLFSVRANIARMWRDAGFDVGLGGFNHLKLYSTPVDDYIANIERNEKAAKQVFGENQSSLRYFSYPFLNTGKSVEDRTKVETWLAARGYSSVKYTFDNQEWMYSYAYDMARNDNDLNTMKEIRGAYLNYIGKMFDHYEAYSAELFGRDIPQTMVLTPSRLIADTADEFFSMATKRGYTFVTIDEAQSDPAYRTNESFTGEAGISWFERWSMARGQRLRHEPDVDESVKRTWEGRKVVAKK